MTPTKKTAGFAFHATQVLLTKDRWALNKEKNPRGPGRHLTAMQRQPADPAAKGKDQYRSGPLGIWKQYGPCRGVFTTTSPPTH